MKIWKKEEPMGVRDILNNFGDSGSMFFNLKDGEEKTIVFLDAEEIPNSFDGGKTTLVRYHIKDGGVKKYWDRTSRKLAKQMVEIPKGATINIKRIGQKSHTKYLINLISE